MNLDSAPKVKYSRFRHIFAKSVRRSEWYDAGPGHGLAVAANPKMIALAVDVPAGGIIQVAKLMSMGRGNMQMGKIKEHEVYVNFFRFFLHFFESVILIPFRRVIFKFSCFFSISTHLFG